MPKNTRLLITPEYLERVKVLLETIRKRVGAKTYSKLGPMIGIAPSVFSKMQHGHFGISSLMLIRFHEATGMEISEMKEILGTESFKQIIGQRKGTKDEH